MLGLFTTKTTYQNAAQVRKLEEENCTLRALVKKLEREQDAYREAMKSIYGIAKDFRPSWVEVDHP